MRLTESELAFLSTQRLGRLATVAPGGQVQNNPVGFFVDAEAEHDRHRRPRPGRHQEVPQRTG
ncbi:pyridoxamine 5'-phosphate oxidase family protein [Nonomuraea ferruginea]